MRYRKPYRIKKKKSLLKSRYFWRMVLGLILGGEILYFLFFSPVFQIKEIKVLGNEKVKTEDLINFIPQKSIFTLSLNKIKENILKEFPRIEGIEVKRDLPSGINLAIKERQGAVNLCLNNACFLVDGKGVAFENILEENSLPKVEKNETAPFKLGDIVLDKNILDLISIIVSELTELSIPTEKILVFSNERLNIKVVQGWEIYLNPQEDAAWQSIKLKAVLENEIPQEKRKNLEYIELRFGNLAPYKYR